MSQYSSRIHIKVKSPEVWSRFEEADDAGFELASLAKTNETSFIIDCDFSFVEDELDGAVEALAETLGQDGIIIADTTNINVDPYEYCNLYLGDKIYVDEFNIYNNENKSDMFFETKIEDIAGWLNYARFRITEKEKKMLYQYGIAYIDGHYTEFSTDIKLPSKIYLRETSFNNRTSNIEKTSIEDEIYLVHAKDSYDPLRIEVMSKFGSLGYLPSEISDQITPSLVNNSLSYTAKIVELIRLSERNKHAKSPIVAISIEVKDIIK